MPLTDPVPGTPAAVLSAVLRADPDNPPSPGGRHRASFSLVNIPNLPSLVSEVVWLPEYALLDANGEFTGMLISQGWATKGVTSVTAAYTPAPSDAVILANATGGAFAVTLPDATQPGYSPGQRYTIVKTDSSANAVTVNTSAGQLISGGSAATLSVANAFTSVVFDGTTTANWWVWAASATSSGSPSGSAGGDLTGTYPGPLVAKINGVTVSYVALTGTASTDTTNIQNLINSGAKTIVLSGAGQITSAGLTPASGVRLTGQGYTATSLTSAGSGPIFNMDPSPGVTQIDNIEIDHLTLNASAGQPIFSGMYLTRSSVHDCYLNAASGSASSSIWKANSGTGYMAECRFYNNREQVYATSRTVPAWLLQSTNNTTLFQVNDNHWYDNVCFNNNQDTAQYHYKVSFAASSFSTATCNGNTFEGITFEFPCGGMILLDSCSYTTVNRCINLDLAANTVGNPLVQITKNANGGGPVGNKIRSYSRRAGSYAGITDIQLASNCNNTVIDSPFQAGGGTALTINYGSSSNVTAIAVPSSAVISGSAGTGAVTAATAGFAPSNPTGTSNSTTGVMMGLGSTIAYTPTGSGEVLVNLAGVAAMSAGAAGSMTIGARFGTGSAPANGASPTGTAFGPASDMQPRTANVSAAAGTPFAIPARLSLTAGTAYWFDILVIQGLGTNTGGPVSVTCIIAEQLA